MRIAILANSGSWYAEDLSRAIRGAGHESIVLDFRTLYADVGATSIFDACEHNGVTHRLCGIDAVIVRTMPAGSLEQVVFRMDVLARIAEQGVVVVNEPRAIECAVDKYLTTAKLAAAGLPIPRTVCCETVTQAMTAFDSLHQDVVLKPLFGAEGRGIVRLTDTDTAFRVFKSIHMTGAVIYLQQFVQHEGFDTRVLVLGGEVVASMRRTNELDFRTNVSQQGRAERYAPNESEIQLATSAACAIGTHIAGVDILCDQAGRRFVLEVNAVPGWKALRRVTDVDVAAVLVKSIEQEVRNR